MLKFTLPILAALTFGLSACQNSEAPTTESNTAETENTKSLPAFADYISCLPKETALMAAHRGTARNSKYPENSMSALKRLIDKDYLVSEIDVARLKDGVHILYHDGVWEEKSTGKGVVPSSTWKDAEKVLLNDTRGRISSDRPVKFEDYLKAAKNKIYLEIDFKSSSKYETVIKLIRKHAMADQVLLISYSQGQSRKLAKLAPDMMLSVGPNEALGQTRYKPGQIAAWIGYDLRDKALIDNLRSKNVPVLGRIKSDLTRQATRAGDILVTDNIFNHPPIAGLNKGSKEVIESCLAKL